MCFGSLDIEITILLSVTLSQHFVTITGERPKCKSYVHGTSRSVFVVQVKKCFCQVNDILLAPVRLQRAASITTSKLIFAGDMYILKAKQQEPILSSVVPCPLCNHFAPQNMVRLTASPRTVCVCLRKLHFCFR